jgi:magnesium transporter
MIVGSTVYVDGRRAVSSGLLEDVYQARREPSNFAWFALQEPNLQELQSVADRLRLDESAMEDAIKRRHQPKLERRDNETIVVLECVRYVGGKEPGTEQPVQVGWIYVFTTEDSVVTVCFGEDLVVSNVRKRIESEPERVQQGPNTILHEVVSEVANGYDAAAKKLNDDIWRVESDIFVGRTNISRCLHVLIRAVVELHQAVGPLARELGYLLLYGDPETRTRLSPIRRRVQHLSERLDGYRELLSSLLEANITIAAQRISAWGAILIVPPLIAGIFGMNFTEEWWTRSEQGFEVMILILLLVSTLLYLWFKRLRWL